ncbi:MAG: peptidylprolyl isomerase [Rhodobacteraceae bacterium]|nr:MAG: peptidylprolyl isomerase [Paracoccaceae bacterium]
MRGLFTLIASVFIGFAAYAADPENTLMIEVAGKANGIVEIELLPDVAPNHVAQIKKLAREGQYNDVVFHRVIDGFMAQTGDVENGKRAGFNPRLAGTGKSSYPNINAEFSDIDYVKGVVGMARSQSPHSANSQFFIMFAPAPFLNNEYTVFGRVLSGQDVVDGIKRGEGRGAKNPDYMLRVWIKADEM